MHGEWGAGYRMPVGCGRQRAEGGCRDDWLEEGHLAWFVIDAISLIDTSAFDEVHPDGPGRPAYDPKMLLGLLLYGYATGVRSSRAIMAACRSDLAYRVIAVNLVPDHRTIARFRAENEQAIETVFVEVLRLCAKVGLAGLGQIAIDGTKIGSDAALDQNRDANWIRAEIAKILSEAATTDATEDAAPQLFEAELPEPLRPRHGRLARLEAALAEVEAQERRAQTQAEEKKAHARSEAAAGRKLRGRKPTRSSSPTPRRRTETTSLSSFRSSRRRRALQELPPSPNRSASCSQMPATGPWRTRPQRDRAA